MANDEKHWLKQLVICVGAAVVAAAVAGLALGLGALGAVNVLGISDPVATSKPSLYMPPLPHTSGTGATGAQQGPSSSQPSSPAPSSPTTSDSPSPKAHHKKKSTAIQLTASPQKVAAMQPIHLDGRYPGGDGHVLQVQEFQGGWTDFPVTATVRGGSFATYVQTGHTGPTRFRVVDKAHGRASKPVTVTVK